MLHEYGQDGQSLSLYEGDHIVPISECGCPGPGRKCDFHANFWPEIWTGPLGAHAKDAAENKCLKAIRTGKLTLAAADAQIAKDWTTACK